jgi:hypothetical protein
MSKSKDKQQPIMQGPTGAEGLPGLCSICKQELPASWKPGDKCPSCGNFGPGAKAQNRAVESLAPLMTKLEVQSGDVVIIRSPMEPVEVPGLFRALQEHLAAQGKRDVRFLIIPPDVEIETAGEEWMRERGWVRATT